MTKKFDVFISHAEEDKKVAQLLCNFLEERNISCWIAPRDITGGADYGQCIIEAIRASRIMIVVFSKSANKSVHVRNEIERATHYQLHILPYKIDASAPTDTLELFLSAAQWISPTIKKGEHKFAALYKACTDHLNKPIVRPVQIRFKIVLLSVIVFIAGVLMSFYFIFYDSSVFNLFGGNKFYADDLLLLYIFVTQMTLPLFCYFTYRYLNKLNISSSFRKPFQFASIAYPFFLLYFWRSNIFDKPFGKFILASLALCIAAVITALILLKKNRIKYRAGKSLYLFLAMAIPPYIIFSLSNILDVKKNRNTTHSENIEDKIVDRSTVMMIYANWQIKDRTIFDSLRTLIHLADIPSQDFMIQESEVTINQYRSIMEYEHFQSKENILPMKDVGRFKTLDFDKVTIKQWRAVDSNFKKEFDLLFSSKDFSPPVTNLNFNEINAFILKLNSITGKTYRLPTDNEYKYVYENKLSADTVWFGGVSSSTTPKYALTQRLWGIDNSINEITGTELGENGYLVMSYYNQNIKFKPEIQVKDPYVGFRLCLDKKNETK